MIDTGQNIFGGVTSELFKINSGSVQGIQGIRNALAMVKRDWTAFMVAKIEANRTSSNIPYRTGFMFRTFNATLRSSLQQPGTLKLGAPGVEYAGHVDAMRPWVSKTGRHPIWTGGGNRYQWWEKTLKLYEQSKLKVLRDVIKTSGLASIANQSVSTLATSLGADL